ncbi:MAG: response regulator transcription factor [Trebonia sp.]
MTLVAIVDDHRLFNTALAIALRAEGLRVAWPTPGTPCELDRIRERLLEIKPDVLLIDRMLGPRASGEDLIYPISNSGTSVVVVSAFLDDWTIGRCLALGAGACISKAEPLENVLAAVAALAAGEKVVPAAERARLIAEFQRRRSTLARDRANFELLTSREEDVLAELVAGRSVREIAARFYVSEPTVRSQVRAILTKLNVRSQLQAVAAASAAGWKAPSAA